jgi:hypothetical protein
MTIYEKAPAVQTRWSSFENLKAERGQAARENKGAKGHAFDRLASGERKTLLDVDGSGIIHRIWLTISDRSPEMLRGLRLDMSWDGASQPAVSAPLGDFFGIGLGRRTRFECALFAVPEGRSFISFLQMPFRKSARITITNESDKDLVYLFYDINISLGVEHTPETLYLHAHWRRESPNALGQDYVILPEVPGCGRFLGCNVGVIADPMYEGAWWGEGEVKVWFGGDEHPTLCGTGTEDYVGTAWGQGTFAQRLHGCPIADGDNRQWAFYRYHLDDPIYFNDGCRVAIQTIGGCEKTKVLSLHAKNVPLIPVSIAQGDRGPFVRLMDCGAPLGSVPEDGWCNFWRQDDWSATAYFYHESPAGLFPALQPAAFRSKGLSLQGDPSARKDT